MNYKREEKKRERGQKEKVLCFAEGEGEGV